MEGGGEEEGGGEGGGLGQEDADCFLHVSLGGKNEYWYYYEIRL